jgi:hypothetical protein
MRFAGLLLFMLLATCGYLYTYSNVASTQRIVGIPIVLAATSSVSKKVVFAEDIEPILRSKCQSCHFQGGRMYAKLPFDRAETIKTLGTKLFTRLQDENDRRLIREFLSQ